MFLAGFFSGAVGYAELLPRYRDNPVPLLGALPTFTYIAVNIAPGVGALALTQEFNVFDPKLAHRGS